MHIYRGFKCIHGYPFFFAEAILAPALKNPEGPSRNPVAGTNVLLIYAVISKIWGPFETFLNENEISENINTAKE